MWDALSNGNIGIISMQSITKKRRVHLIDQNLGSSLGFIKNTAIGLWFLAFILSVILSVILSIILNVILSIILSVILFSTILGIILVEVILSNIR